MNQYDVSAFPEEVCKQLKNYVYRLIDPRNGDTFYVGRGKGNRVFQHIKCATKEKNFDEIDGKYQTIRDIENSGLKVIHVIHKHGMDELTARHVEAALIDAYPGASNKVAGYDSNYFGSMNAVEIISKYKSEEAVFKHKIIMITVNRSSEERTLYDATRYAWKINKEKAQKAEYAVSVIRGIIKAVYKIIEWKEANKTNFPLFDLNRPGRYGFIGEKAENSVESIYINKRIPDKYRKRGAANPIRYSFY
ncbi:MAG: hypothetical protein JXR81_06035 [Candidatus Goldbacteria bacterium]|nr:hypothetical protein [Candidatus Goldiibacteriota bacterium]